VKDPSEPFAFSFPDLDGRIVSNSDPRFRGKIVIVSITGSWCPNCHDEAPLLAELYRIYGSRGLEIVALAFEEKAQLENPVRVRAFAKQFGLDYTFLLAGEPSELAAKLPQAEHLEAFPTSFFLGRDGRVRFVHTGFSGRATGTLYTETRAEVIRQVEQLLSDRP
jgi:thiol-disulfide isomerase/thioredoxin